MRLWKRSVVYIEKIRIRNCSMSNLRLATFFKVRNISPMNIKISYFPPMNRVHLERSKLTSCLLTIWQNRLKSLSIFPNEQQISGMLWALNNIN